ncbi:magnesium transporter [Maritimibacter sp. 55A14]|uniref:magnesium transporter CorA family protein n=1 Tax=Maritimibacter sp. 55A14 TaxID=2174844 RepID=UPI000D61CA67|nr:magnesium transporter CorA family protein [Maritimibacter sp. 55A14]PWE32082.1 magnesium transporter [Maritimibacter sp. 55A14]
MILKYIAMGPGLAVRDGIAPEEAIWLDLVEPTDDERAALSARYGAAIPSLADQEEIEQSSRLYLDNGLPVMTVLLPARSASGEAEIGPVTFILTKDQLVTIRHHGPRPFETFPPRAGRASLGCRSAEAVLMGLLEEIIDRLADITEMAGGEIDRTSRGVFRPEAAEKIDHRETLRRIGQTDTLVMQLSESLLTVDRMLGFLLTVSDAGEHRRAFRAALKSQQRDVRTITEQTAFLQQKAAFLLDATLGLINIEQNAIIKIFSVAAVVFLPPTLIASIYGMNFQVMPELGTRYGYPAALGAMVLSAVIPLVYFKRKGWF